MRKAKWGNLIVLKIKIRNFWNFEKLDVSKSILKYGFVQSGSPQR